MIERKLAKEPRRLGRSDLKVAPQVETMRAFDDLVRSGNVRYARAFPMLDEASAQHKCKGWLALIP
jgi:aryl-alcohol dehydrogenase-like predicted oxidoreductase